MYVTSHYLTFKPITMKNSLLFTVLGMGLFVSSCATAYKSDQTPDDVYFSPGKPAVEKAAIVKDQAQIDQYENYISSTDEQFLRMKVSNYYRWNMLDDYSYWNDSRYDFGSFNYYSTMGYSNYYGLNNWNLGWGTGFYKPIYNLGNPYYTLVNYYNPKSTAGTLSESSITAYKNKTYSNSNNYPFNNLKPGYNNSNYTAPSTNSFSNLVKKVFSSSTDSYDRTIRTFDNTRTTSSNNSSSNYSAPSSIAGGNSGGVKSSGSSASSGRTTRN